MYLSNLKIWNFRKISTSDNKDEIRADNPGIDIFFNSTLNILVGENNSGKTAIVDAIRLILGTHSFEYQSIEEKDFYHNGTSRTKEFRIECLFSGFSVQEAGLFLEWLHFNEKKEYELRVWLYAYHRDNRVIYNIRAGIDEEGAYLDGSAKDLLRITYLKPLRDAEMELSPGYKSRLAQILIKDPIFWDKFDDDQNKVQHVLEKYVDKANKLIKGYFSNDTLATDAEYEITQDTPGGGTIKKTIQSHLNDFFHKDEPQEPEFHISGSELSSILKKLGLSLEDNKSGLGALNQLFIATELLLLQGKDHLGLRLALIEELEAHLHPQAQLRVISALQAKQKEFQSQFILTTHSTVLSSKIQLKNMILCFEGKAYSLDHENTQLQKDDYEFLERFLDATKSNLFYAKGVILVEGDAENILIPAIAELINRPLHKYGVSIVNVGSKALMRYVKIFQRKSGGTLPIKVAVVTDLDVEQVNPARGQVKSKKRANTGKIPDPTEESKKLKEQYETSNEKIKVFHSNLWTLEYDLSLGKLRHLMNYSTFIAQLSKSRSAAQNFKGVEENEAKKRIRKAHLQLKSWQEDGYSDEEIAFKIYHRLKENKASKAVTAQWLSKLILSEPKKGTLLIKNSPEIGYLLSAIYHVTEPNAGN